MPPNQAYKPLKVEIPARLRPYLEAAMYTGLFGNDLYQVVVNLLGIHLGELATTGLVRPLKSS